MYGRRIGQGDAHVELGDTALIAIPLDGGGTIEVVLWTARTQTFHPAAFESVGCGGLKQRPLLVVKSTNHFYGGFAELAREVHYVDTVSIAMDIILNVRTFS